MRSVFTLIPLEQVMRFHPEVDYFRLGTLFFLHPFYPFIVAFNGIDPL